MKLTNKEKKSLMEFSRDRKFWQDIRMISDRPKKMSSPAYLDFLTAISKMFHKKPNSDQFSSYQDTIF